MVKDAKAKGATPVLVSAPARATFSGQTLSDQVGPALRRHAGGRHGAERRLHRPHLDHDDLVQPLGPKGWQQYHALGTDMTHTNAAGASKIAGFVEAAMKSQNIGLAKYLR